MTFTEQYHASQKIQPNSPDYFRLIPQDGVVHTLVEGEPNHNAIWDMNVRRSDGRVFFSVCGEGVTPEYAHLYEYHRGGTYTRHFDLEKETIQHSRRIRASKFHTSIHFLEDGRLIMQTHTTSPSPLHPAWMPESYVNHQWESFEGSTLLLYNPDTKIVQSKGVLAPYSTLYGGGYSAKANLFFGFGTFDGYGWVYDLNTGEAKCIGQVTDGRSNRLYEGPDGHLYYGTASGDLARLNTETCKVEFLARTREHSPLRHGAWDGDTFWFSARTGKSLYKYELSSGTLTEAGRFFGDDDLPGGNRLCYGLDFDSQGVLWFCSNQSAVNNFQGYEAGVKLYKWDVRRGKPIVDFGFLGTPLRTVGVCAQLCIHDDIMYVTDGNHFDDPVGIIEVDLRKMTQDKITDSRLLSNDAVMYISVEGGRALYPAGESAYDRDTRRRFAYLDDAYARNQFLHANTPFAQFPPVEGYTPPAARKIAPHSVAAPAVGATGVALWERVGYGNGSVDELTWADNRTLSGLCGNTLRFTLSLYNGELSFVCAEPTGETPQSPLTVPIPEGINWPCMPGRQYLAVPECSVKRLDGSLVVGTKDMMLCLVRGGQAYGLGAVTTSGGVHCLSMAPDGMTVYGVAGYELGKGDLFRYDDQNGLRWLGSLPIVKTPTGRQLVNYQPWRCAISPDGKHIAIGMRDEMSGVAVFGVPNA
jgi:hypothetical protein